MGSLWQRAEQYTSLALMLTPYSYTPFLSRVSALQELFPGSFRPTATHFFMDLLHEKGLLARCYTQNIDSLESMAGLPKDAIVAAHGNFDSAGYTPSWGTGCLGFGG